METKFNWKVKIGGVVKKFWILCALVVSVGACSSKEKTADTAEATTPAPVATTEATAPKETAKTDEQTGSKSTCTLDKDTRIIEVKKRSRVDVNYSIQNSVKQNQSLLPDLAFNTVKK